MAFVTPKTASDPSSSSALARWEYDVFLSFSGEDTRKNFTDHLYAALNQRGIRTFRDDEKLEKGKPISPKLLNAIQVSRFAVIVLSRNYASSSWCLDELVKIVECTEETGLIALPVFYHVNPSDVRKQKGTFAAAFAEHEGHIKNKEKVQKWKDALTQVANLSGWDLQDEQESTIIEEIVGKILSELNSTYSSFHMDLVGINSRVEEMKNLYSGMGLNDVRFIGIWGMGGIGKTTIAQVLYDRIRYQFDGSCFLSNIREKSGNGGLVPLQKQLLSDILIESNIAISNVQWGINVIRNRLCHKKVIVILDDVDQPEQLEALAGDRSWFGRGSLIIMTTRDQHLLIRNEVTEEEIYKAKELNDDEALKLFSWKAFKQDYPAEGYEVLSKMVIYYAKGLPLALEVLGSFLFRRKPDAWESALGRLKESPERKILDVLQISFDSLRKTEQKVFLDIACFFKGMNKDRVANILRTDHYKPHIDIDVLMEKSLITISHLGTLQMHDLLQELGKEIVCCESPEEPGQRSRLWRSEHVLHVLKHSTGTEKVESISLSSPSKGEEHLNVEAFSKMKNLRLLKISNVQLPHGLNYLSNELQFLNWDGYPLESMPTSFQPYKLVELIMPHSRIKQLWDGIGSSEWLKLINLSNSKNLIMTPDFTRVPNLEILILKGCTRMSKIHASLGDLKRLILLDLNGCIGLKSLPYKISLESLEIFVLSGCSRLKKFPEIVGNMLRLSKLYLDGTAIKELPLSVERLTGLTLLNLRDCKNFSSLPSVICNLTSLKTLTLSCCSKLDELPEYLGNIEGLEELDVSGTAIKELPLSVECLTGLTLLNLRDCKNFSSLPSGICNLMSLKTLTLSCCSKLDELPEHLGNVEGLEELDVSGTAIRELPSSIIHLKNLTALSLRGCEGLSSKSSNKLLPFPAIPSPDTMSLIWPSLSVLRSLTNLDLSYCNLQAISKDIGCLSSLRVLNLSGNNFVCLPESINQLSNLIFMYIVNCTSLRLLPELPLDIDLVMANGCSKLEALLDPLEPKFGFQPMFSLLNCFKLVENQGYGDMFLTKLRSYHQERYCEHPKNLHYGFGIVIPGSKIPKWYSHQSVGTSVNLQVPSYLCNKMGIAFCAVFVLHQHHPPDQLDDLYPWFTIQIMHSLGWTLSANGHDCQTSSVFCFAEDFGKVESHHLWLNYLPPQFFKMNWNKRWDSISANGFIQIGIKFDTNGPGLEVKKCGISLVYEQDIEDLSQTNELEFFTVDDCNNLVVAVEGSEIESSHVDHDRDGPSGEHRSNETQHRNIIDRLMLCLGIWIENFCTRYCW